MKMFKRVGLAVLIGLFVIGLFFVQGAYSSSSVNQAGGTVYGTTTSTGSAINVPLGFLPSTVIISRVSVTAANNYQLTYTASMPAASGILHTAGGLTWITSAGISLYAGSATNSPGFTIGTNSSINPSSPADTLYWQAWQ